MPKKESKFKKFFPQMFLITIAGIALAFWEAIVVIYLRLIPAVLKSYTLPLIPNFPAELLRIEQAREAATIVVLAVFSLLVGKTKWQKFAVFLWIFAIWDIFYYVFLYVLIGWPSSLTTVDVVFLIPSEWRFSVYVVLTIMAILLVSSIYILKKKG